MTDWTPEKIKQLRQRLGLTQTEFGERIGVKLRCVQYYESGERSPRASVKLLFLQLKKNIET